MDVRTTCSTHFNPEEQGSQVSDRPFKVYFYKETFGDVWLAYSEAAGVLSNHTVDAKDSNI